MKARSLEIDRDGQRRILDRVAIDDEETTLEFLELVGDDRSLLAAVRKLKPTRDRGALDKGSRPSSAQGSASRETSRDAIRPMTRFKSYVWRISRRRASPGCRR
jgi:hypothetical protein